jgi:hypothetical protein
MVGSLPAVLEMTAVNTRLSAYSATNPRPVAANRVSAGHMIPQECFDEMLGSVRQAFQPAKPIGIQDRLENLPKSRPSAETSLEY